MKIIVSKLLTCKGNFALKRTRETSTGEHLLIRRSSDRQCFLLNTSMYYPTATNAVQITRQSHSDICTAESCTGCLTHTPSFLNKCIEYSSWKINLLLGVLECSIAVYFTPCLYSGSSKHSTTRKIYSSVIHFRIEIQKYQLWILTGHSTIKFASHTSLITTERGI